MPALALAMARLLRRALTIVAVEWAPDMAAEMAEKRDLVATGWRVLDEYEQAIEKRRLDEIRQRMGR